MRMAIVSDTHFGDDQSQLVSLVAGVPEIGPRYADLKKAVDPGVDYLVLAGDILDLSIAAYEKAYACARVFLQQVQDDRLAREIIYVAGNHDADVWHMIQHQRSVINRVLAGKVPEAFQHSVAGIVDDRQGAPPERRGLTLAGVRVSGGAGPRYGGMFLDSITRPPSVFNFAYPNLYVVTDAESVLVTHGQYLEPYWSILGEIAPAITGEALGPGVLDIEKTIEMNFPLNQLACTGVGQAGILTEKLVHPIQLEIKEGNVARLGEYLDRLRKSVDRLAGHPWYKALVFRLAFRTLRRVVLSAVRGSKRTRYREDFFDDARVQDRLRTFYAASLAEIEAINSGPPFDAAGASLPAPGRIIAGHTHEPIPWSDPKPIPVPGRQHLKVHNTGGWLVEGGRFSGAEVFLYETGRGFSSVSVG
jgi:hypothetical protein